MWSFVDFQKREATELILIYFRTSERKEAK
jgi:hypothetical protein